MSKLAVVGGRIHGRDLKPSVLASGFVNDSELMQNLLGELLVRFETDLGQSSRDQERVAD
jgi:hypothetical protein